MLRAQQNILYRNRQIYAGQEIKEAEVDPATMAGWLACGSVTDKEPAPPGAYATRAAAKPGSRGRSSDGDPDAIAGQMPDREIYKPGKPPSRKRK